MEDICHSAYIRSGVDNKQVWTLHTEWDAEETQWGRRYKSRQIDHLLVGIKDGCVRLRFPETTSPVHYLDGASRDLKCLAACAISGVVPLGILADKLEEEYPDLSEQANHLRKWEQVHKEKQ